MNIIEPQKTIPVRATVDVCVVGGSCTGVFAAVRAARLGATVAIVEKTNCFGGVATNGLVNVWHSFRDTEYRQDIIGGLSLEIVERLRKRNAAETNENNPSVGFRLNSEELKIELDQLIEEHRILPFLHAFYSAPLVGGEECIEAVFIEDKSGRGAIRAKVFVDASGDGDLAAAVGIPFQIAPGLQPPTTCAKLQGFYHKGFNFRACYREHREEFSLPEDSGWSGTIPETPGISMLAENHVFGANCAAADELTRAEMEGRRLVRAQMDMIRAYGPPEMKISLVGLASYIGIRETRRFAGVYTLTEEDVLWGRRFPDGIANGSYRVDVHNPTGGGFVFKYLDGTTATIGPDGNVPGRWREELSEDPTFYQVPYRSMVHEKARNLIMAGRMIATDRGAFGAVRVMVNLNQVGEAAGVAAVLATENSCPVAAVDPQELRKRLAAGGSIIF